MVRCNSRRLPSSSSISLRIESIVLCSSDRPVPATSICSSSDSIFSFCSSRNDCNDSISDLSLSSVSCNSTFPVSICEISRRKVSTVWLSSVRSPPKNSTWERSELFFSSNPNLAVSITANSARNDSSISQFVFLSVSTDANSDRNVSIVCMYPALPAAVVRSCDVSSSTFCMLPTWFASRSCIFVRSSRIVCC